MILAVALAGGVGAVARHLTDVAVARRSPHHVVTGIVVVNVVGSFLLGVLTGCAPPAWVHSVFGVGFCGGFTTFSAASVETLHHLTAKAPTRAFAYAFGTLVAALAAASIGYGIGRLM